MKKLERKEYKDGKNYSGSWILEYDEYQYPKDLVKVTNLIKEKLNPNTYLQNTEKLIKLIHSLVIAIIQLNLFIISLLLLLLK